jgi:hypothetical protein
MYQSMPIKEKEPCCSSDVVDNDAMMGDGSEVDLRDNLGYELTRDIRCAIMRSLQYRHRMRGQVVADKSRDPDLIQLFVLWSSV